MDYTCVVCGGAGDHHFEGTCHRCSLLRVTESLLAAASGAIPDLLTGLPDALAQRGRPESTMRWLLRPIPKALIESLGAETAIDHTSLDACPSGQARHHLRGILVDAGVLPPRDEQTDRLETWMNEFVAQLPPHHAAIVAPYSRWRVMRVVRQRARRKRTTVGVATSARERVRVAARFLRHLEVHGQGADAVTQDVLDAWTGGNASRSADIAPFVEWLNRRTPGMSLRVETAKVAKPSEISAEDAHHGLVRALVVNEGKAVDLPTRVAALLVLLYGARIEELHRLTTAEISHVDERTYVTLSSEPVEMPAVVAGLVNQLAEQLEKAPHAVTRTGTGRYLFASPRRHHEPIHPTTLGRWLANAGVRPRIARNYAMLALASDVPAAVVAAQLGLTAQAATRWAQFAQRDNTAYIAARSPT